MLIVPASTPDQELATGDPVQPDGALSDGPSSVHREPEPIGLSLRASVAVGIGTSATGPANRSVASGLTGLAT